MHDIALDLERLFGTRIVILDEALAQTRYFAYFTNNETLDQILSAINAADPGIPALNLNLKPA